MTASELGPYWAHSDNNLRRKHPLEDHLRAVARQARCFALKFGGGEFGYLAGLWHDLGKFHADFQAYITNPERARGPDHSSTGMVHAARSNWDLVAFPVAGHHAGLPSRQGLIERIRVKESDPRVAEALTLASTAIGNLAPQGTAEAHLPSFLKDGENADGRHRRSTELFIRMVFSALTDADFLDTEAHFDASLTRQRGIHGAVSDLWQRFERDQERLASRRQEGINFLRDEVYRDCLAASEQSAGVFSLTVPTGGGKTRSGMAFALCHAMHAGLERVIVAIPYTSIIDQNARVYREILGEDVVLEHHSAIGSKSSETDPVSYRCSWQRLASENWDAPVVVTTTVQLFESLFSDRPSKCRRLHSISRSVLILDEVQTLPAGLLEPILDVVQELVDHYEVSVVLSTATQPALKNSPFVNGFREVREIIRHPAHLFEALRRVEYEIPDSTEKSTWLEIADRMRSWPQCLAVVNTKRDAFALLDALGGGDALHLSTQMCGAHRAATLDEVKRRLDACKPCQLVSTQVIEAGVDIDFPVVFRAVGPLDRIVQSAGRCNREGRLGRGGGKVIVFDPADGGVPSDHAYRTGTDTARSFLTPGADLHDPALYERYFERLFQAVELDRKKIQECRSALDFPEVASRFRIIDDETSPVVVRPPGHAEAADRLLARLRNRNESPRWLLRALQPYLVNVRSRLIGSYYRDGLVDEVVPGLWEWFGGYDSIRGLVERPRSPEELVI